MKSIFSGKSGLSVVAEQVENQQGKSIYWVQFDNKNTSTNTLTLELAQELETALTTIDGQKESPSVLIFKSLKTDSFIVGANINMLKDFADHPDSIEENLKKLQNLMNRIRKLPYPTIALINGVCLGGGLELCLAMDYRIAVNSDKVVFGFPEVKLGLCPGAGGCVYTPNLIGLLNSLDLLLSGDPVGAERAKSMGLIDNIIEPTDDIRDIALKLTKSKSISRNILDGIVRNTDLGRALIYNQVNKQLHLRTRLKYPAPYWILEVMLSACELPVNEALKVETTTFAFLLQTKVAQESIKMFLCQDKLKKVSGDSSWVVPKKIGIVGAGLVGKGLAHHAIERGFQVVLIEKNSDSILTAKIRIELLLRHSGSDKKKIDNVKISDKLEDLKDLELVFETIPDVLEEKITLLKDLEKILSPSTIIVTTTSSLLLSDLSKDSKFKTIMRMNFEYPIFKYPYVEVTCKDADYVLAQKFIKDFKKIPYKTTEGHGYVSSRLLASVFAEMLEMIVEGYKVVDINESIKAYGLSIKPLDFLDAVGIDHFHSILSDLSNAYPNRFKMNDFLHMLYKEGSFGMKSNKGFSPYLENGSKITGLNPTFYDALGKVKKGKFTDTLARILFRLLNESLYIVEERLIEDPMVLDVITSSLGITPFNEGGIFGIFRDWKPTDILDRMKEMEKKYGSRFAPSKFLKDRCSFDRLMTNEKTNVPGQTHLVAPFDWELFPKHRNNAVVFWKWGLILIFIIGFIIIGYFGKGHVSNK